ncbi:unnamed protein product, partial [Mesorhabditis spiculigera]
MAALSRSTRIFAVIVFYAVCCHGITFWQWFGLEPNPNAPTHPSTYPDFQEISNEDFLKRPLRDFPDPGRETIDTNVNMEPDDEEYRMCYVCMDRAGLRTGPYNLYPWVFTNMRMPLPPPCTDAHDTWQVLCKGPCIAATFRQMMMDGTHKFAGNLRDCAANLGVRPEVFSEDVIDRKLPWGVTTVNLGSGFRVLVIYCRGDYCNLDTAKPLRKVRMPYNRLTAELQQNQVIEQQNETQNALGLPEYHENLPLVTISSASTLNVALVMVLTVLLSLHL